MPDHQSHFDWEERPLQNVVNERGSGKYITEIKKKRPVLGRKKGS